jgi:hypothetical protein
MATPCGYGRIILISRSETPSASRLLQRAIRWPAEIGGQPAELGGSQISTLLETLPGIANVLRSPVADTLLNVIRSAAHSRSFRLPMPMSW